MLERVGDNLGVRDMSDDMIMFGKYKGSLWEEVPDSYLQFLVDNPKPGSTATMRAKSELFKRKNSGAAPIVDPSGFKKKGATKDSQQIYEGIGAQHITRAEFNDVLFRLKRLEDTIPGDKATAKPPPVATTSTPYDDEGDIAF